jgi:DMSO/TMAO reductase YedYZ molybdopterin-dependent catalytic subunit
MAKKPKVPGVDADLLVKDAMKEMPDPARRLFLKGGLSVGALVMLTGCDLVNEHAAERILWKVSRFNDRVQWWLFNPDRLAPTYPKSRIHTPFRFNAFYPASQAPAVDPATYKLELDGLIANKAPWTLAQLYALPQVSQITRHVCVEGWSMIGAWRGAVFSDFLKRVGADTTAKYVYYECADGYYGSIDMPTALHPQTQMTFRFGADDIILPRWYGFPFKIRIPTKLGFKNPKHVVKIAVVNDYRGGYWPDQGYNWFSGL